MPNLQENVWKKNTWGGIQPLISVRKNEKQGVLFRVNA